ncbi:uncharacterized protein K460DRAFT_409400 [Cucurbitaria berberidis CBS 394.84]|uniref:BTB domain-containing protein n=1 Tax=Cucurbitaria berberidis CBS 394.84 TaxID=1168544 RepID=A0A9P4GAR0_9PLEO|nr:uncharacterized protein K460DRAFT_409400 [Cucurbitaria berberidis CBS 394.84]KAF1841961.1 hypothetical protein K460DRAFT_409400 [Cucurbitaria berberidis CBS 394.84]
MDDLSFLDTLGDHGASDATLKAVLSNGHVYHISDRICPYKFLDTCPLLYHAFEYGFQARPQASIDAPSRTAIISLLRYCYTGSYLTVDAEYLPIHLLLHAEIYKMAEDFDVPELQLLAHGNFSCQIDCACALPTPPSDLLETIRFIYQNYADYPSRHEHGLVNNLTNYCISNFFYHKLGANADFAQVVSEIPAFRQDLCRTNIERNFQDDCAFEIIRLALDTPQVHSGIYPTLLASRDLPQEMLFEIPPNSPPASSNPVILGAMAIVKDEDCRSISDIINEAMGADESMDSDSTSGSAATTLVHRPKNLRVVDVSDSESNSSSDEDGFALVHRPKPLAQPTPDEPMSSPKLIPFTPVDILAATGSDYPSDDEWDMLRCRPPPYSILNPRDRLIVQHPSPANILTQPQGHSSAPTPANATSNAAQHTRKHISEAGNANISHLRTPSTPSLRSAINASQEDMQNSSDCIKNDIHNNHLLRQTPPECQLQSKCSTSVPDTHQPPPHRMSSPTVVKKCTHCHSDRETFEFPSSTPTARCQHPNTTCSYCLHNIILQAVNMRGWDDVRCEECWTRLSLSEIQKGVLLWMEKG